MLPKKKKKKKSTVFIGYGRDGCYPLPLSPTISSSLLYINLVCTTLVKLITILFFFIIIVTHLSLPPCPIYGRHRHHHRWCLHWPEWTKQRSYPRLVISSFPGESKSKARVNGQTSKSISTSCFISMPAPCTNIILMSTYITTATQLRNYCKHLIENK